VAGYVEPGEEELRAIYADTATIAVVGASANPEKPAHTIPAYLREVGFRIVPVNPAAEEVLGVTAYPRLEDVPVPVDVVEVFRPSAEAPEIARSAVAIGAKVLWLQEGIVSEEAAAIAREGGLRVVMDRCMGVTHRALFG
jgi:predicted CoA-binding protein